MEAKMIQAIVKIQGCTTKPGRRAFVSRNYPQHGIARGPVRHYIVTASSWAAVRRAVAGYDTSGGRTMGFTNVNPDTVESFTMIPAGSHTYTSSSVVPMPTNPRQGVI